MSYYEKKKGKYMLGLANLEVPDLISHRPWSYDVDRIASRVAEICEIELNDIFLKGKQQKRARRAGILRKKKAPLKKECKSSSSAEGYDLEKLIERVENQWR